MGLLILGVILYLFLIGCKHSVIKMGCVRLLRTNNLLSDQQLDTPVRLAEIVLIERYTSITTMIYHPLPQIGKKRCTRVTTDLALLVKELPFCAETNLVECHTNIVLMNLALSLGARGLMLNCNYDKYDNNYDNYQLRFRREWRPSLSVISAAFIALGKSCTRGRNGRMRTGHHRQYWYHIHSSRR